MRTRLVLMLAVPVLALVGCGEDSAAGEAAYRDGRFEDARAAFAAEEERRGESASAALAFNRALSALRAGEPEEAEAAAERAAERDPERFAPLADFLRGHTAWRRCRVATAQASGPEAEPFAFQVAIDHAEAARAAWIEAATSRADWPEARRNVERAARAIADLKRQKTEAETKRTGARPTPRNIDPPEPPAAADDPDETETEARARRDRLDPAAVRGLLDRLAAKEREKRDVRRAQRRSATRGVEKDW